MDLFLSICFLLDQKLSIKYIKTKEKLPTFNGHMSILWKLQLQSLRIMQVLKSDPELPKICFCLLHWKPFKSDEKIFIFHVESSFLSWEI